ncbi:MAG: DUF2182 domain-containing protein [Sphingomicrobium sp.]
MPLSERIVRRERAVVIVAIVLLAGLAWRWTLAGAGMRGGAMAGMAKMTEAPGVPSLLAMWWLMMVAMMLPSAAPAILLYGRVRAGRGAAAGAGGSWLFLSGYLLAWLGVSLVATIGQIAATRVGLIDGMTMRTTSPLLGGAVLIAAGLYQVSPTKNLCLVHCRSPASFLSRHWRPGAAGAVRLGLLHGGFCIGCCWLLMALLFVGGVMDLAWIAGLAVLVAVEKLVRFGPLIGRVAGALLMIAGVAMVVSG